MKSLFSIRIIVSILLCTSLGIINAQSNISGIVSDDEGRGLIGANIYLEGTYDGTSSNSNGIFELQTEESGMQVLRIEYIGYETFSVEINLDEAKVQLAPAILKEAFNELHAITISTVSFLIIYTFCTFKYIKSVQEGLKCLHQYLRGIFSITDDVNVAPGRYDYFNTALMLRTPSSSPYRTSFSISTGQYYDGFNFSPSIKPSVNMGASLELAGTYKFDYVKFDSRDQQLSNHIFGIRGLYMISTQLSLSAFIQYNTAIDKVISNVRFRYNPKEGTDIYIVFNEGRNTYLERTLPNLPIYDARSVMLKFTYTFDL